MKELDDARDAVLRAAERHGLHAPPLADRLGVWSALGPVDGDGRFRGGHARRAALALLCAMKAVETARACGGGREDDLDYCVEVLGRCVELVPDPDLRRAVASAAGLPCPTGAPLAGDDLLRLRQEIGGRTADLENWLNDNGLFAEPVGYAGMAVAAAFPAFVADPCLERGLPDAPTTDDECDRWDADLWASGAAALAMPWEDGAPDAAARRLSFWRWWAAEAVPGVAAAVPAPPPAEP